MSYLIITEKESARKKFSKALLGSESRVDGQYQGTTIHIASAAGHIMEYLEPHEMVAPEKAKAYKSWKIDYLPWNTEDFNYRRRVEKGKKKKLDAIKLAARQASAIVIATDLDPTGEGDLIGQEIVDAIGWKGTVLRLPFADESPKAIQKGFSELYDVSNKWQYPAYLKAESRSRFDYNSMQITRAATYFARKQGLDKTVLRNGRLKSVIIRLVFEQEQRRERYVKKPLYESQFKDNNGHIYKRPFKEGDTWRYQRKEDVPLHELKTSTVSEMKRERKTAIPPRLLVLDKVVSSLAPLGYKAKEVKEVYQRMYEKEILSYPRTEDFQVTKEQFNELLPKIDAIAAVIGVDTSLLTHRSPRSSHVKNAGLAHGANRPGSRVPQHLSELDRFDGRKKGCAQAIYKLVARRYLAMFGENYIYDRVTGQVDDYKDYVTQFNLPVSLGFKQIESFGKDDDLAKRGVGTHAEPFVAEIINKMPERPTSAWLTKQLEKLGVGTPATRTETIVQMVNDQKSRRQLTESVGRNQSLATTLLGQLNAVLLKGSYIADPESTKRLGQWMEDAGNGLRQVNEVADTCTDLVKHDIQVFEANVAKLDQYLAYVSQKDKSILTELKSLKYNKSSKAKVNFQGQEINLRLQMMGDREPTEQELQHLLNGESISVRLKSKRGKAYQTKVAIQKDPKYGWSIAPVIEDAVTGTFKGETISIRPYFGQYQLNEEEMAALFRGDVITISTVNKTGKKWSPKIGIRKQKGRYSIAWIRKSS